MEVSLVANTGIQYYTLENPITFNIGERVIGSQYYYERQIDSMIFLDPVYYFPANDAFVRRDELFYMGYLDKLTGEIAPEDQIDFNQLNIYTSEQVISISNLSIVVNREKLLEKLENQWLPIPMYDTDIACTNNSPTNWCRMKMIPTSRTNNGAEHTYKIVLAFDTQSLHFGQSESSEAITFMGEPLKLFSLCGISSDIMGALPKMDALRMRNTVIPMKAYEFCDLEKRDWIDVYLKRIFFEPAFDISKLEKGKRLQYLAYYMYFISYIHAKGFIPTVTIYSDSVGTAIDTTLVLDIGNSRTYGLIAESPIHSSFSNVAPLEICDLETGQKYNEPFDMRLAFHKEQFGEISPFGSKQFVWPSILRMGKEAHRLIYKEEEQDGTFENVYSYYSSPKRYLWDDKAYSGQWEYISSTLPKMGASMNIDMEGIVQQFNEDGSFASDPQMMGVMCNYSRRSLMTFCFIEIILQAQMQANAIATNDPKEKTFRAKNGQLSRKRVINEIIITCPTAMARTEQIALRKAALEAYVVIDRYKRNTYSIPHTIDIKKSIIKILPSVRDLLLKRDNIENRSTWTFDEATCCQMVYLFAEAKRYNGKINVFFQLYGKIRNISEWGLNGQSPSLIIGSLDMGAGTTDMMICAYSESGDAQAVVTPIPLFGESFTFAGDDLIRSIIKDFIIESEEELCPGIIGRKLKTINPAKAADLLNLFFTDLAAMGVQHRRMRSKFNVQIAIPIAQKLLELLRSNSQDRQISFDEIFTDQRPSSKLLDYFSAHFGFRFEELTIPFSKESLNKIIKRDTDNHIKKWAAMFASFGCDIVLLGGRPCSLPVIHELILQSYPVAPNRLISMNTYRVGNWYPGSDGLGNFGDRKSLVAVGALIAELADKGTFSTFRLNISGLIEKSESKSDYLMIMPTEPPFISINQNCKNIKVPSLPIYIYARQLNLSNYPSKVLYRLEIDEQSIERSIRNANSMGIDTVQLRIEIERRKSRIRHCAFLEFTLERDYHSDKEALSIVTVFDSEGNEISRNNFSLHPQSIDNEESHWLDSGIFKVNI